MQTPKELFLELLKPEGKPERQLVQYEALAIALGDPIGAYLTEGRAPGTVSRDRWGVTISFPAGDPGPTPLITPETKVCPDITHWRDYVHAPDIQAVADNADWSEVNTRLDAMAGMDKLRFAFMGTGIFEECHFLMGFEDTLANLYEHPKEMHELIDYITEYRILYAKLLMDNMKPDGIFSHDDWGSREALFMKPEMWREFFKEPYRKFYGSMRDRGVLAIHHGDSFMAPIVEDMAEIGICCWQGVLPENNIPELQARLKGKMILMGGVGAAIDRADSTEPEIRAYVRNILDTCCPGGHFIPCITYGIAGTVFPHVDPIINAEIDAYNAMQHNNTPVVPAAPMAEAAPSAAPEAKIDSELSDLAAALCQGKKKQVVALCEEALSRGIDPKVILAEGLVPGMTALGDDFSAGRAFVPEMLIGARCMNAALEILKPLLTGTAVAAGRVCLGTVKGDLHDIGKNLVKIMLEGCGLAVIDLGTDVPAEEFVKTAAEEKCDIIACSSLLTTSMNEMRRVVELAKETGIRDEVKILIGGAPITQEFCDAIGADAYTSDAGAAARVATLLLEK